MPKATQPIAIDGIEFDALLDESREFLADIPDYPTEQGFDVSDTISLHSPTLSMTLFLSDTPVTWRSRVGEGRADDVVERLEQVWAKRELVDVVTTKKTFKDMGITSIKIHRSKQIGYAYEISISLKQVRVTQTKTVGIPASYGKSGKTGTSAGKASTSAGGSGGSQGKPDAYMRGLAVWGTSGGGTHTGSSGSDHSGGGKSF